MTYHSWLKLLNLESLEVRKLRADWVLAYKILFGVTCIESDTLFTLRNQLHLRGHNYTLLVRLDVVFSTRVVNMWNNLPADTTDFISLCKFRASVSKDYLLGFCTVYFV